MCKQLRNMLHGVFCRFFFVALLAFHWIFAVDSTLQAAAPTCFRQISPEKPNEIAFDVVQARFLKFVVYSSQGGTPAIDELLVYGEAMDDSSAAVNLARVNVKQVAASSCIEGYAIHRIENLIDGRFGNDASWVALEQPTREVPQWASIEWNDPVVINRVVFSRDRFGKYSDRVPLEVEIQTSNDGVEWQSVASLNGATSDLGVGGIAEYGSPLFAEAPYFNPWDWRKANEKTEAELSDYDSALHDAFLAEENAILKTAGFADCERWLIQRRYPEFVEPEHKPDNVLPLPVLDSKDIAARLGNVDWKHDLSSVGTVYAFSPGSFASGPVVEQSVRAQIVDDGLCLQISGNRFLADALAIVATENLPVRGAVVLRGDKVYWKQIDLWGEHAPGSEALLDGSFDSERGVLTTTVPLSLLPECRERGVYVSMGIGGRNVLPGGRPVHFRPAPFAAEISHIPGLTPDFSLRIQYLGDAPCSLVSSAGEINFEPGESKVLTLSGVYGQAGPEVVWNASDAANKTSYSVVGFRYDPCYRPLCQLKDALVRAANDSDEIFDEHDFHKLAAVPGAVNPRYVDVAAYRADSENEYGLLTRYFEAASDSAFDFSDDDFIAGVQKEATTLWKEWKCLHAYGDAEASLPAERDLFRRIRTLKRNLFLSNSELEPVEHILANKRHPFWPTHNYSDLFDSTWNPGGAVVMIDVPRKDGRLAPELATTKEVLKAGNGVIRNPSPSFDARRIYYAYRESVNDYFKIYELNLATGEKRLISSPGPFHDFWPTELPDGGLAFISTRCKKKFICWRPQAFVLFRMNKDGGDVTPLSHANLSEFTPSVSDNGTILWTRSEYVDKGADYGHTLWTIRPDGTAPELVFGNTINLPQGYASGRRVPDSDEVCCVMISHFGDLNGPVAFLNLSKGPHDPSAIQSITPEVPWPGYWGRFETFREPFPVSRDVVLVAHAPLDRFGLYLIDRYGNRELLTIDPEIDTICPQPFGERDLPPVVQSPPDPKLAEQGLGHFSVENVYRGLEGQVEPGTAKYLRICQEMPTPLKKLDDGSYQADHEPFMEYYASPVDVLQGSFGWTSYVAKGVLGTVEIENDGSVDFLAPSGKVLFFELLDEDFNEIQRMRSVVQLQPGERRSCIGCHENRLSVPEGGLTQSSAHGPQTLVAPPWGAGPFWYERVVQPVLNDNCVYCHSPESGDDGAKRLNLTAERDENKIPASYRSLIQSGDVHYFDYTWGDGKTTKADPYTFGTSQSKLWKILKDENHQNVDLSSEEEQAIKCWIDLNVPLWGDYQFRSERD